MTDKEIKLFNHQLKALEMTKNHNKVAYYLDMGLGKTFVGSEKMKLLGANLNIIVCQKSKIEDWCEHIKEFYKEYNVIKYNKPVNIPKGPTVIVINYDLLWRRPELLNLKDFTLMLDESSYIKNESSKRTKFVLKMKPSNVILLSGTPISGKYEELWSQCKLLGWDITKTSFWNTYVNFKLLNIGGFKIKKIIGYRNVERLKRKLRQYGAVFMKTEDVFDLPNQVDIEVKIANTKIYKIFKKDRIYIDENITLIGYTTLTKMLYERQLCSIYNSNKLNQLKTLLESTNDRIIIFYNFKEEYNQISKLCEDLDKPISVINGEVNNLENYNTCDDSVTLVQYQAGAMGINLQKCNKIIYYSLTLRSELFEQSKKRTHRIGQERTCMYYYLIVEDSIEENIMKALKERKDYTDALFEEGD